MRYLLPTLTVTTMGFFMTTTRPPPPPPPAARVQALVKAGADLEAKDKSGLTALQVSLLAGWQVGEAERVCEAGSGGRGCGEKG